MSKRFRISTMVTLAAFALVLATGVIHDRGRQRAAIVEAAEFAEAESRDVGDGKHVTRIGGVDLGPRDAIPVAVVESTEVDTEHTLRHSVDDGHGDTPGDPIASQVGGKDHALLGPLHVVNPSVGIP